MQFKIIKSLIISLSITFLTFQSYLYSSDSTEDIEDYGIISLMYHRFEENKYPSTNIRIKAGVFPMFHLLDHVEAYGG